MDQSSSPAPNAAPETTMSPHERAAKELLHSACLETNGSDIERVHTLCNQIDPTTRFYRTGCCENAARRYDLWRTKNSESTSAIDGGDSPDASPALGALERAKAAVIRGDQRGCINALENEPRTGSVVRALWYCYYNSGNIANACRLGLHYNQLLNSHQKQAVMARCRQYR